MQMKAPYMKMEGCIIIAHFNLLVSICVNEIP